MREYLVNNYWSFLSALRAPKGTICVNCRRKGFFIVCEFTAKCVNNPSYQALKLDAIWKDRSVRTAERRVFHAHILRLLVTANFFRMHLVDYLVNYWSCLSGPTRPSTSKIISCRNCEGKEFFIACEFTAKCSNNPFSLWQTELRWGKTV